MKETLRFIIPVLFFSMFAINSFAAQMPSEQSINACISQDTTTSEKTACISQLIKQ